MYKCESDKEQTRSNSSNLRSSLTFNHSHQSLLIMPRTVLNAFTAFYVMAATLSLNTAAPTTVASAPASTTISPVGMEGNPAVLTFNQSQCLDMTVNGGSRSDSVDAALRDSLCHGHFLVNRIIERTFENAVGHCSNNSLSIVQVVTNMKSILYSGSAGRLDLHILASVLKTYHSMAVQVAADTSTDESTRTQMQKIIELLRGLVRNYFKVISPNHCSCTNASSCVMTVDLTGMLNLSYFPSNCSLAAYISQHLLNDHRLIYTMIREEFTDLRPCPTSLLRFDGEYERQCGLWIDEYIRPYSSAYIPVCQ